VPQTFGAWLDRPDSPCNNFSRFSHLSVSNVKSKSSMSKMSLPAVISIAFFAVLGQGLGQGQTSKLQRHHTHHALAAISYYSSSFREPLHIHPPTPERLHATSGRSSKRRPRARLLHLRLHSHHRNDRLHQPNLPDPSSGPRMFGHNVPGS